jgi:hypothetical protein
MATGQEVIIVLSSEFVPKLVEFALSNHVWAVRTAATEGAAGRIWEEHLSQETDPLTSGLTLFKGEGDPEDDLLSILDEVELHHGMAGGHILPMSVVKVFGTGPTEAVREAFGSLGFSRFVLAPDGFIAYRLETEEAFESERKARLAEAGDPTVEMEMRMWEATLEDGLDFD